MLAGPKLRWLAPSVSLWPDRAFMMGMWSKTLGLGSARAKPLLTIFAARFNSTTALCCWLWSPLRPGLSSAFKQQRQSGGDEGDVIGEGSDTLVEPPGLIAEAAGQRILRHDAEPNFVGDQDDLRR